MRRSRKTQSRKNKKSLESRLHPISLMGKVRLIEALERSTDPQPASGQQGFEPTSV